MGRPKSRRVFINRKTLLLLRLLMLKFDKNISAIASDAVAEMALDIYRTTKAWTSEGELFVLDTARPAVPTLAKKNTSPRRGGISFGLKESAGALALRVSSVSNLSVSEIVESSVSSYFLGALVSSGLSIDAADGVLRELKQ